VAGDRSNDLSSRCLKISSKQPAFTALSPAPTVCHSLSLRFYTQQVQGFCRAISAHPARSRTTPLKSNVASLRLEAFSREHGCEASHHIVLTITVDPPRLTMSGSTNAVSPTLIRLESGPLARLRPRSARPTQIVRRQGLREIPNGTTSSQSNSVRSVRNHCSHSSYSGNDNPGRCYATVAEIVG
jgi:hypothetical protein